MRRFYRSTVHFEVLSEEPIPPFVDLAYIGKEAEEGRYVGRFLRTDEIPIDGAAMAEALVNAGSDPGFFMLDSDGFDENDPEPERNEWEKDD